MIALDTNVLVRYLMQDDPAQARRANTLIDSLTAHDPALVPLIEIVELGWGLLRSYKLDRNRIAWPELFMSHLLRRPNDMPGTAFTRSGCST